MDADLQQAKAKVEATTREMGDSADKNIGGGFKDSIRAVTSFVGAVTSIVGTFYVFERLGEKIGTVVMAFVRAKDEALEFRRSLRDLSTDQLSAEFDKVAKSTESGFARVVDWGKQLTDVVGLTEEASQAAKLAAIEAEQQQKQQADQIERRIELEKKLGDAIDERNKKERAAYEDLVKFRLGALEFYRELEAADLEAFRSREQRRREAAEADIRRRSDEIRAERAKAAEIANAVASELANATKSQSFAQSIAGPIEEMTRRLEVKLEQLKYGGR
jgi:hypothetical protein